MGEKNKLAASEQAWALQVETNNAFDEIDRLYAQAASKAGLSDSAFAILYALGAYGDGCTQKELCGRCWIGKQTVNSSVKRLAAQGIVSLEPGHGRETLVKLTSEGRALVEEKIDPFVQAEAAAFGTLSEEEQRTLLHLLSQTAGALRASFESAGML